MQTTLRAPIQCNGIALHSGVDVQMTLKPAPADTGIIFKRTDVEARISRIPARYDLVTDTCLGTTLHNKHGVSVSVVEHLMAALWGAGVDNVLIEISGAEIPVMDGSSEPFMALIKEVGLQRLPGARKVLRVLKPVTVTLGDSTATVEPYEGERFGCSLDITIDFPHPLINRQRAVYDFADITFADQLSRARTFGFAREVEYMRSRGLARGGSLENAVVLSTDGILNEEGLRYKDEFIRHKALDCVGDLYLAGGMIEGAFTFERPGHGINNALLRALFADKAAWKWVNASEEAPARKESQLAAAYL